MVAHMSKPATVLAGALTSPGTLNTVVLFTVVAVAELLLNDSIFVCPCQSYLIVPYGLSFVLVPAVLLFLADFPWKLVRGCLSPNILCSLIRRPVGLAITWIIIGFLQRRYTECMTEGHREDHGNKCEVTITSVILQLVALYVWLFILICTVVMVLCRRTRMSCITGRSSALEMQISYEMKEKEERAAVEKKVKYGVTDTDEEEVSADCLERVQPGVTTHTYNVLKSERLLQPSVLRFVSPEDLLSLDISVAQRCLLRNLLDMMQRDPNLLTSSRDTKMLNKATCPSGDASAAHLAELISTTFRLETERE